MLISSPVTTSIILLIFTISNGVAAQSSSPEGMNTDPSFSVCMAVIVVFMGLFIAAFSIYIRYCSSRQNSAASRLRSASARDNKVAGGLDHEEIEKFPTLTYAEIKAHKIRDDDLECAICVAELEDNETLRWLIPKCDHVFHQRCIDAWLESHVTCPVCRAKLDVDDSVDDQVQKPVQPDETVVEVVFETPPIIQEPIRPDLDQKRLPRNGSMKRSRGAVGFGNFRSNSTGHSGVNVERFTLRLPEENRKEIMHRTKSYTSRSGGTAKGVKTGRSKSGRLRMGSLDPCCSRALSMISRDNSGEGSSSKSFKPTANMIPSIKCLDPKPTSNICAHVMVDPV